MNTKPYEGGNIMKFKKIIVWMLMLAMILNLPTSTLAATSPVAPCKNHVWGEWDPIEDPTCTTTGKQIRYCQVCFTEQIGTIPKLPHSWDGWTVTKEPTCTSTGSRFHTCTVCGTRETETMDKAPHKYGKWVDIIPATCSSKGSHYRICDICGYQQTLDSDPLPHTWSEWVTTKNANCTERGEEERTCQVCGTTEKRTTKVNGTIHEWGEWVVRMEPDCEKGGYRSHGCTKCNKWESEKTPPLGHDWGEWTILTPASKNAPGLREHKCTRCGKTEKESYEYVGEPGLQLICLGISPTGAQDGYEYVFEADMVLENTGDLPLEFSLDSYTTSGTEVLTDAFAGSVSTTGTLNPGETLPFTYLIRTNDDSPDSAGNTIERYLYAGGRSPETGKRTSATAPLLLRKPQKNGLMLDLLNVRRSGEGKDEEIIFDLSVTNLTTAWSLIDISASSEHGELPDGEGFIGLPEEGLLVHYQESASFSYRAMAGQADLDASAGMPFIDVSRWISAKDAFGHAANIQVSAHIDVQDTADAHLEGTLDVQGREILSQQDPVSFPAVFTLRNTGKTEITNPVVSGCLATSVGNILHLYTLTPVDGVSSLKPQESASFEMNLDITAEDEALAAAVQNSSGFSGLRFLCWGEYGYDTGDGPASGESNLWKQDIAVGELNADDPRETYILPVLTASYEDRVYHPGETVSFDLTVTNVNPTDTINGIRFEWYPYMDNGDTAETPLEIDRSDLTLLPGESCTLENAFSRTITKEDALRGYTVMEFIAWCHSSTHDWWSNCGWHGLVRTEPGKEKGIGLKIKLAPSTVYSKGRIEWKPVDSPDTDPTGFLGLKNTTPSGNTAVSDAALYNGDEWMPSPAQGGSDVEFPACIIVTNTTDQPVTISIDSDHPDDQLEVTGSQIIPGNGVISVDYWIHATPEEIADGELDRTVTVSTDSGVTVSDTITAAVYDGNLLPSSEEEVPDIVLICTGIELIGESSYNQYVAHMIVRSLCNMTLSLEADFFDDTFHSTPDALLGWYESDKRESLEPYGDISFDYSIVENEPDKIEGFVRRTLRVTGKSIDTGAAATSSFPFVFPSSHGEMLDLSCLGYHRLNGPEQIIVADLRLTNHSEETLKGVRISSTDRTGYAAAGDHLIGVSEGASYSLDAGKSMDFRAEIHPTDYDFSYSNAFRTVTATCDAAPVTDFVELQYALQTDQFENVLLHLDGEMLTPDTLEIEESFNAYLKARNLGNIDLENVLVSCTAQGPDGQAYFMKTYGTADGTITSPGKDMEVTPVIPISYSMIVQAAAANCLKNNEPSTVTFTFTASGTARREDIVLPVSSNPVSFTVHLQYGSDTESIQVRDDLSMPGQNPKAGEKLFIPLIIENTGDSKLQGFKLLVNQLHGQTFLYKGTLLDKKYTYLKPGETLPCLFEYTVTDEDMKKGSVTFSFTASAVGDISGVPVISKYECSKSLVPEPAGGLVLEKSVTNTPPEGQTAFRLGNEIHYLIKVTNNTGEDLEEVRVYDDVTGYEHPVCIGFISLMAGETRNIPFNRVVCPLDVQQLQVENQVYATYHLSGDPNPHTDYSDYVVTPVEKTPVTRGVVSVFKEVSNHPLDPKGYALNEQIDYDITVHNGHVEDVEIDVWDHVWGTEAPELVASVTLAPGETRSFSHAYIVREVDLPPTPDLIGKVINEACVGVLIYDGRGEVIDGYTAWAEPVEAPTIRTATPEKKDPPETPAVTPKAQTGGGESCRRVLTGHGSVGSEYDLLFCTKHSMLETVTRKLPVSEAIDAWKDAVNSGYDALAEKAGAETAALIHIDQLLFFQQLDAYQSMLTEVFGEEKAGETILQHLRERSNDLCYALHHAPAERPDSILRTGIPVLAAKGERAEACGRTIEPIAGGYHVTQTVCRTHDFITSRLGLRLTDASMEEKTAAFEDAGKLWMSLLMKESNTLYAGLTDEGKSAMSASLNLFQGWLTARRNVLLALYPDDASVAAQLFSNTVRSYVLDLEVLMK